MPAISKIALPYEPSSTANRDADRRREDTRARRERELAEISSPPLVSEDAGPKKAEEPPA
jgi:hypothetical protein